ncbi:MAG: adenylate kinase, partial [Clostridiales bacterium]|nr:adenylate kinase [Clostridiales bacterium]
MDMKLVLLGTIGAGKGTQAKNLSKHYNIPHISTGDMLREQIHLKTELGSTVQRIIDAGNLIDDDLMLEILKKKLNQPEYKNGYILDGFPRTLKQAEMLTCFTDIDRVIFIKVDDHDVVERLTGRRVCSECGEVYHVITNPPTKEDICDVCGAKITQRADDKPETVRDRLKIFHRQTEPLINYYSNLGL